VFGNRDPVDPLGHPAPRKDAAGELFAVSVDEPCGVDAIFAIVDDR
jgi:hypothetical protein